MRRRDHSVPASTLLRRLGWHHQKITCRDGDGQRSALYLRRRATTTVEIELPGGTIARLTNAEAGQLRAALRELLIGRYQPHHAEAA